MCDRFDQVPLLQDLFKTVKPEVILEFLKAADFYELFECLTVFAWLINPFLFFFIHHIWLFEALTCSRREDGLSCWHCVKPPLTHCHTIVFVDLGRLRTTNQQSRQFCLQGKCTLLQFKITEYCCEVTCEIELWNKLTGQPQVMLITVL